MNAGYGHFTDCTDPEDLIDPITLEWSLYLDAELNVKPFEAGKETVVWQNRTFQIVRDKDGFSIRYQEMMYMPWIGNVYKSDHSSILLAREKTDSFLSLNYRQTPNETFLLWLQRKVMDV